MQVLESKWGNNGYAFWFKLLELLGSHDNHYIDCRKPAEWEFMTAKTLLDDETASNILQMLSKLEAIDSYLWMNHKVIFCPKFLSRIEDAYRRRKESFPTLEKVYSIINVSFGELMTAETPQNDVNDGISTEREREREREIKEKTQTTDENRVEVLIRKSVEEKRQFIRDRFHFTDNEIEIEVEEIILKCQKRSPGPDVWLFISRWFKNRRDEINVREKSRTGEDGTRSHIGTNNVGNGTSGAFEEEFVDRSHLWNL